MTARTSSHISVRSTNSISLSPHKPHTLVKSEHFSEQIWSHQTIRYLSTPMVLTRMCRYSPIHDGFVHIWTICVRMCALLSVARARPNVHFVCHQYKRRVGRKTHFKWDRNMSVGYPVQYREHHDILCICLRTICWLDFSVCHIFLVCKRKGNGSGEFMYAPGNS